MTIRLQNRFVPMSIGLLSRASYGHGDDMQTPPAGSIAVIFLSRRNGRDAAGYADAAAAMAARAAAMPGYLGIDTIRGDDGAGITISWWADRAAAIAWRDDADHVRIRAQGRAVWYDSYRVIVAEVERGYDWRRPGGV